MQCGSPVPGGTLLGSASGGGAAQQCTGRAGRLGPGDRRRPRGHATGGRDVWRRVATPMAGSRQGWGGAVARAPGEERTSLVLEYWAVKEFTEVYAAVRCGGTPSGSEA